MRDLRLRSQFLQQEGKGVDGEEWSIFILCASHRFQV